ncbi:MSC_0619 family F1-like ATPase alpha subunit [Mesomycoplasma lagogenitalium]|uniref:ATP F0F1 synthase subunit alpha n=1 Tax=Mesomycoplasma lagogenitalium TaxID=171286 RepID=A0ABY8LX69_9BACT|nr:ATP F0F1 synthase subunit alpha [Mesomycoplasma lagogenitalium]WGI37006.1 ATP F0F1 synthase subunit alpha [Mesomycoplasma lagogenitalium]
MNNNNPKISAIFDYVVEVTGKYDYRQRQNFYVENVLGSKMMVLSATEDKAFLLANSKIVENLKIGDEIKELHVENNVFTSKLHFGKIIDINGNIIFPNKERVSDQIIENSAKIFGTVHELMKVKTLNEQLYTGITSIDLLIPIGKGQRQLIIGDRQTGKTHLVVNTILNQAKNNIKCIYVAIGQKREDLSRLYQTLKEFNALNNTIIIDAPATSAYEQYLAPYIGMAHAENLSKKDDVLIIFDDLTKHANIFREMALLTDKPVGKEAMPGDIFFAHSSLLERAGSFKDRKTITALPILKTIDGDITSLISSNIISITDGQIITSSDLFDSGKLPAIDIDLSVSRTGSSVQSKTITKVAGEIGKIFRAYKRHLKLALLDFDFNKETTNLLYKGEMIEKMFLQRGYSLYSPRFVLLMSKLILWGTLKNVKNEQKAMMFLNILIDNNQQANDIFQKIQNNFQYDENIVKNFFSYALLQYSNALNLNWNIKVDHEFIDFKKEDMDKLLKLTGDK